MAGIYHIETYEAPEGGWLWRIVGETHDYGCEVASSEVPLAYQWEAEEDARNHLARLMVAADR